MLGVVWGGRTRQLRWAGAIIVIYFLFYTFLVHMLFALLMGLSPGTNLSSGWGAFLTREGLTLVAVQLGVAGSSR